MGTNQASLGYQHWKWMLRAINMMVSIVTSRIILTMASAIVNRIDAYYDVSPSLFNCLSDINTSDLNEQIWSCQELAFTLNDSHRFNTIYPGCSDSGIVLVKGNNTCPENQGTSPRLTFGMSLWLAVAVHIILMEFHVSHRYTFRGDRC